MTRDGAAALKAYLAMKRYERIRDEGPPPPKPKMVYAIQCTVTGLVKIGHASDPISRLASLQIGSPTRLAIIAVGPGGRGRERDLQRAHSDRCSHGEWFRLDAVDVERLVQAIQAAA